MRHPEPGKLHDVSFLLESGEKVLRAVDILSMSRVSIDIGQTRHGVMRGTTIYTFDPSDNRFETFCGDYQTYPGWQPIKWASDAVGASVLYPAPALRTGLFALVRVTGVRLLSHPAPRQPTRLQVFH